MCAFTVNTLHFKSNYCYNKTKANFFTDKFFVDEIFRGRRLKKQRTNDEAQCRNGELLNVSHNCNEYENLQQAPDEIYDTVV